MNCGGQGDGELTSFDSELTASDDIIITVTGLGGEIILEVRVKASSDDAEEKNYGSLSISNSDLELV